MGKKSRKEIWECLYRPNPEIAHCFMLVDSDIRPVEWETFDTLEEAKCECLIRGIHVDWDSPEESAPEDDVMYEFCDGVRRWRAV